MAFGSCDSVSPCVTLWCCRVACNACRQMNALCPSAANHLHPSGQLPSPMVPWNEVGDSEERVCECWEGSTLVQITQPCCVGSGCLQSPPGCAQTVMSPLRGSDLEEGMSWTDHLARIKFSFSLHTSFRCTCSRDRQCWEPLLSPWRKSALLQRQPFEFLLH